MEVQKLLITSNQTGQGARTPPTCRDPFESYCPIQTGPNFMASPQSSEQARLSTMHRGPSDGWERLQFNRMRAQIEDLEGELRGKGVQLAMLYHELQEERLRHGATREALGCRYEVIQRSVDAGEVLKALSALGDAVGQLTRQQCEILEHYSLSGGFTGLHFEELPLDA